MPASRGKDGRWRYRKVVHFHDGSAMRISGTPDINTKVAAEAAERAHIERALREAAIPGLKAKEVPTFEKWFDGRFWNEWVVGHKNKPSEVEAKRSIYKVHLAPAFGDTPLDEIGVAEIASFRASLVKKGLSEKRINNILGVLSKALRYAVLADVIERAPVVGIFKVEAPEIVCWELDEYGRILAAAAGDGTNWYVATCLAGDAGLRIGEVKALQWENVDFLGGTVTVSQQVRRWEFGTPKGRTRRSVPMTERLRLALEALPKPHQGLVLKGRDGQAIPDNTADDAIRRICKRAALPVRAWHTLRHSFGTHAALFSVNPWHLMTWMGHKDLAQTLRYVHFASQHMRPIPPEVLAAATDTDPARRVIQMLGARGKVVAKAADHQEETPATAAG
jgi:integrase